jgi:hypothetical protein
MVSGTATSTSLIGFLTDVLSVRIPENIAEALALSANNINNRKVRWIIQTGC